MTEPDGRELIEVEAQLQLQQIQYCGVDEAGAGPLCGDVVAAAVILDPDNPIEALNDSKKISEKKRERLFDVIKEITELQVEAQRDIRDLLNSEQRRQLLRSGNWLMLN